MGAYHSALMLESYAHGIAFSGAIGAEKCGVCGTALHSHGINQNEEDIWCYLANTQEGVYCLNQYECLEADCKMVRKWFRLKATYYGIEIYDYCRDSLYPKQRPINNKRWGGLVKALALGRIAKNEDFSSVFPKVLSEMLRQMAAKTYQMPSPPPPKPKPFAVRWTDIWHYSIDGKKVMCGIQINPNKQKEITPNRGKVSCLKCVAALDPKAIHPAWVSRHSSYVAD